MEAEKIIQRPLVLTEKGTRLREKLNKYLFEVDRRANKIEIKKAIEKLFKVDVADVRTMVVRGRVRRIGREYSKTPNWKKAVVSLKQGQTLDIFEGK